MKEIVLRKQSTFYCAKNGIQQKNKLINNQKVEDQSIMFKYMYVSCMAMKPSPSKYSHIYLLSLHNGINSIALHVLICKANGKKERNREIVNKY